MSDAQSGDLTSDSEDVPLAQPQSTLFINPTDLDIRNSLFSRSDSGANSVAGETDQLASSDSESDEESSRPLSSIVPASTGTNYQGAQATSQGGAIAGPGPSSLKRSGAPLSTDSAPSQVTKKKRARASLPFVNGAYHPPPLPHYTVTKATKNSSESRHVIRINDNVTDASRSKWPSENEFDPNNKNGGKVYWYERPASDSPKHKALLRAVGDKLANLLGLNPKGTTEYWMLEALPKEYLYTIHHTVTGSNQTRTDPYIFGSPATAKFRTANEIIPHLYWLIEHGPNDNKRCQCKYCAKKSQADVNRLEGLDARPSSVAPIAPTQPRAKRQPIEKKEKKPAIQGVNGNGKQAVKSRTFNADSPEPSYAGAFVDKERDADLRLGGPKYRKGELVWAEFTQGPLVSSPSQQQGQYEEGENPVVTYWPAVVKIGEQRTESKLGHPYKVGGAAEAPRFTIMKRWVYEVIYLGTESTGMGVEEDQIKQWCGTVPPRAVWTPEKLLRPETMDSIWDGARIRKVNLREVRTLEQAVAPLAFAMQIAAHIIASFSLKDRYIIKDEHIVKSESPSPEARLEMERVKDDWHYQSIYLGSELIWVNDFVRIIHHPKSTLPPQHRVSKNAENRSIFMKVFAISKHQGSGKVQFTGQLYELRTLSEAGDMENGSETGENGETLEGLAARDGASNGDSSKPNLAFNAVPLPPAPDGFKFHRITPGESVIRQDLDYIAGRYYPLPKHLDSFSKINEILDTFPFGYVFEDVEIDGQVVGKQRVVRALTELDGIVCVAGLAPAGWLYIKAHVWQGDRMTALVEAEQSSSSEIANWFARQQTED